jgi:capsular exopolysaccharide synthesis family protein
VFLAQYDVNLREYWRIVRKRKFTVLLVALLLGVLSTAFAVFKAPTPIYSTECVIEIKKEPFVEGVYSQTISWSESDDIETQMTVIKSYAVFEKAAERLGLIPRGSNSGDGKPLEALVVAVIENLQAKVEVSMQKYSRILNIKVTDERPVFAQDLANAVALGYRQLHGEQQTRRTREALRYIEEQLREVRIKLREAEERFNAFSKQNDLLSIDLQSENLVAQAQEIRKEKAKLEEEKSEFEGIAVRLRKFIDNPVDAGHNFDSVLANNRYHNANDALVSLLLKRDTLLREYTPKHPEVMAVNDGVIENARKMDYLLQLQLRSIERRQEELSRELERLDSRTKGMLDKKLEFNRLKREVELHTDMTTLLERKNQEALIKRSEKPEEVNIVKPALLPSNPINPPKTAATGAMGILIGVVFGLLIAFVLETFDTSLGAIEDVENTLKTPVLGVIPQVDVRDIQETLNERHPGGIDEHAMKQAVNLIAHFVPKSMMAESFRALRAGIQFKNTEKKIKTLAITSASPQEGKTLVAVNLAVTMAQAGMKTLLVGSDLRKPTLSGIFGIEASPGLSEVLLGNFRWREILKSISDVIVGEMSLDEIMMTPGLDNLYYITAGAIPPNPAELMESERFDRFVAEAKDEFDMIIFDTAPIFSAVDAAIIGTKMDGMLLLYGVGAVSRGLLRRAMSQLEQVKSQVIGAVLNGMRPEMSSDFEDYKHYKYYYSYSEDGRNHGKKKFLSWLRKKAAIQATKEVSEKKSWKKNFIFAAFFLFVGLAVLGIGVFRNNGMREPPALVNAEGFSSEEGTLAERPSSRSPDFEVLTVAITNGKANSLSVIKSNPLVEKAPERPQDQEGRNETRRENPSDATPAAILRKPDETEARSTPEDGLPPAPISRYSLCLASFPTQARAEKGISLYRRQGLDAYWVEVELSKGIWFRIYSGYFSTREEAEKFKEEKGLKNAEVKNLPYANLIDAYDRVGEAQKKVEALKKQGFSSYVAEETSGKYRIFVGAFYEEQRAGRQYHALKAKGIHSEIVRR